MKFHGRKKELAILARARLGALQGPSRMTVVTGRRRIGKTTLIKKSVENERELYFFVASTSEALLCERFAREAKKRLGIVVPAGLTSFADLFECLMIASKEAPFTLIIDEFQNFLSVNESVYRLMQDIWDRLKDETHLHLVLSGSSSTMKKLFEDRRQPLFGRATTKLALRAFSPSDIKAVLAAETSDYTHDDLLALYTLTGGVPFYVADLLDNGAVTREKIVERMLTPGTIYLMEGRDLLRLEIGNQSERYQAVLGVMAGGASKMAEISEKSGVENVSAYLERLERYGFVEKRRPIFAKANSRNVRWTIKDPFLRFWFRFISPNEGLLEAGFPERTIEKIKTDYPTFSGPILERWFREALMESGRYRAVESWWNSARGAGGGQSEVDVVAVSIDGKKAYVAEVNRERKSFREHEFRDKVEILKTTVLHGMDVEIACLTMEDM